MASLTGLTPRPGATVMSESVVERVALEREVSSYPGFKSTPRLETLFASRRLPRSVLLESFLSLSSVARPSCEKPHGLSVSPCSSTRSYQSRTSRMFLPLGRHRSRDFLIGPGTSSPHIVAASSMAYVAATYAPTLSNTPSSELCGEEAAAVPYMFWAGEMVHVFTTDLSPSAAGAQAQVGHPALKITSLCVNKEVLPLWALSMLAGLSVVVDFLSDNIILNPHRIRERG
ncbi:hypothetical protein EDB86DRAFT_473321 [Lactarius hatsudake]|nr:hypothetical protein EDB86DRAFT_473321 [Lactarius hatsudake]